MIPVMGGLIFFGRMDRQIKLRGFRIEPGEIEVRLEQHPDVARAAVTLVNQGGRRLVAHIVPGDGYAM